MATYAVKIRVWNENEFSVLNPHTMAELVAESTTRQFISEYSKNRLTELLGSSDSSGNRGMFTDTEWNNFLGYVIPKLNSDPITTFNSYMLQTNPRFTGDMIGASNSNLSAGGVAKFGGNATAGSATLISIGRLRIQPAQDTSLTQDGFYMETVSQTNEATLGKKLEIGHSLSGNKLTWYRKSSTDNPVFEFSALTTIEGVKRPTSINQAVNKGYVDEGLAALGDGFFPVDMCELSTHGLGEHSLSGLDAIDGVTPTAGMRVFVSNQSDPINNGIYITSATTWSKVDEDSIKGTLSYINGGNTNSGRTLYIKSNGSVIVQSEDKLLTINEGNGIEISMSGLIRTIGIKSLGVTNDMLSGQISANKLDGNIGWGLLANGSVPSYESNWSGVGNINTGLSLGEHLKDIYSSIKFIKGTTAHNTDTTISLTSLDADVQTRSKVKVTLGENQPTGNNIGDIWFDTSA